MFKRSLSVHLEKMATLMPVLGILGPRQSGKTTLAKMVWPNYGYVSLEDLDVRGYALRDPRGFLHDYAQGHGLIIDEFQRVPELLSYIQSIVDADGKKGRFILTGSQNFLMNQYISQSLAGRIALFSLYPMSLVELKLNELLKKSLDEALFSGCYPRIYTDPLPPQQWYRWYVQTYLERDIRELNRVVDLNVFKRFLQLCAGRIGQLLNVSSLASDCGIPLATARGWLSLLEASYIIFFLQPHFNNFNKRLVKTPKLYFNDTGLVCSLLGIETEGQLALHFARGALMENWVIAELRKQRYHDNFEPHLYFWRDNHGHEVDCLIDVAGSLFPLEIKSGQTVVADYFKGLGYWCKLADIQMSKSFVVYGGDQRQRGEQATVFGWRDTDSVWDLVG